MKLRNKVFAGFAATVLALSMMMGTAMASTNVLPFNYPEEASVPTDNDVWVKVTGSGDTIGSEEIAHEIRNVDITISGNASFDAELIYNSDGGWLPTTLGGQTVDGELVLTMPMNGNGTGYCELVINLQNKTEGPLAVEKLEFKNEAGEVILTYPAADEAPAADATDDAAEALPKTGVASAALFLGLGAAAFGSGAVVLKRKEK